MDESTRLLPGAVLYPASVLALLLLAFALTRTRRLTGRFLISIIWLRLMMQVFPDITHPPLFAGLSLNAMASLGVCAIGAMVVRRRLRVIGAFPIVLLLMTAITVSGLVNNEFSGTAETLLKWGYFFVVVLSLYDCIQQDGDARILGPLLWVFAPQLLLQAVSIALGAGKASEADGSISFIGGYSHEAAFSIVLVTCFAVVSFTPRLNPAVRVTLLIACVIGIFAANYRTSLIALAPLAVGYFTFCTARSFTSRQRVLAAGATLVCAVGVTIFAAWLLRDRMADIAVAAGSNTMFKPPGEFNHADRVLLSGRLYLWSSYLHAYAAGDDLRLLFGFGANAWVPAFGVYAHNTLVSYLYEFGLFGASLLALVWVGMLVRVSRIPDPWLRGQMLFAHVGFIVLNFATMPFWQLEGLILYGLLCGYTLAQTRRGHASRRSAFVLLHPQVQPRAVPGGGA